MSSFDEIIQQKAHNHEAPVPGDTWDNIEKKKRKRRFIFFWSTMGILLCGILIVGYYNYGDSKQDKQLAVNETNSKTGKVNVVDKVEGVDKTNTHNDQNLIQKDEEKHLSNTETAKNEKAVDENGLAVDKTTKVNTVDRVDKVDNNSGSTANVNTVDRVDNNTGSKTGKNKKQVNSSTNTAKTANTAGKKNNDIESLTANNTTNKTDKAKGRNRAIKNDKGKSSIKIENGDTEVVANTKKEEQETALNMPKKENEIAGQNKSIAEDPTANNKNKTLDPVTIIKDLTADSTQQKSVTAVPGENKKEKTPPKKQAKQHAWFIDVAATPVLPIQQYDNNIWFNRTLFSNAVKSEFTGELVSSNIDASVAFSLSVRRAINKRFSAGIGLQYLQLKEQVKINGTETKTTYSVVDRLVDNINGPQLISDTVETISDGVRTISATNSYSFLSVPVFIQYNFIQKKSWSFGGVAGMFVNVFSNYQNEINKNATADLVNITQTVPDKNKVSFSFYAGLRVAAMLNKRLEIFGLPSINWALSNEGVKNNLVNQKIQQAGFSVGLSYKIK